MDLKFKTFDFDVKAASGDNPTQFEGIVSAFFNIDSYGEIVDDGAFNMDLPAFLAKGFIGGLNHDWDNPIGTPQAGTKVVKDGLFLKANVIDTAHGMDVRKMLAAGVVKKLSIGYRLLGSQVLETADDCMAYWQTKGYTPNAQDMARCKNGALLLTRILPFEGSPVVIPANDAADITAVKMRAAKAIADCVGEGCTCKKGTNEPTERTEDETPANVREFEKFLRDAGLPQNKAKAAISLAKSLLRDVAGEDSGRKPDGAEGDGAETGAMLAETPNSTDAVPANSTTADGTSTAPAAAASTEAAIPAGETQTPKSAIPVSPSHADPTSPTFGEDLPSTITLRKAQQRRAEQAHQQFLEIAARTARWLPQMAQSPAETPAAQ